MKFKIVLFIGIAALLAGATAGMAVATRSNAADAETGKHSGEYCWADTGWDWGRGCVQWTNHWRSVKTPSGNWKYFTHWSTQFGESSFDWQWWDYNYEDGAAEGEDQYLSNEDAGFHIVHLSETISDDHHLWLASWLSYGVECTIKYHFANGKVRSSAFECVFAS